MMTMREAKEIVGTLGGVGKMPGTSYGLPAAACRAGAALAKITGTVCAHCYALKDFYMFPNAQQGQHARLGAIEHPRWVDAMTRLLSHTHSSPIRVDLGAVGVRMQRAGGKRHRFVEPGWHRWHDSGDLQSVEHFARICEVARRTPNIRHWLPTQELRFVVRYVDAGGIVPKNLTVRVSTVHLDEKRPRAWPWGSMVCTGEAPISAYACPAKQQGNRCLECRACWDRDVEMVAYAAH